MNDESMHPGGATHEREAHLSAGVRIKGDITGREDLRVDGTIEGSIQLEGRRFTVGESAKVTADITAAEIVIYGTVQGNLRARDRVEIKKNGTVVGDVTTSRILVEDGAQFKGSIEIDRKGSEAGGEAEKPQTRPATAKAAARP